MATAVVQLYTTESPAHSLWIKRTTGIACFIRDSTKRSYFVRVYCLLKNELFWEEEMYESIYINKSKEYLLDFEGRVCIILSLKYHIQLLNDSITQILIHFFFAFCRNV